MDSNEELHRRLWNWLADNPNKAVFNGKEFYANDTKQKWPEWQHNGGNIPSVDHYCFACEECHFHCSRCPITWNGKEDAIYTDCTNKNSEYEAWKAAKTPEERSMWARIIANLDWEVK
jgi:hypothetical protein